MAMAVVVLALAATAAVAAPKEQKELCKNGGWQNYGFKNQGQCISYVNGGGDLNDLAPATT
jgi:hypothetical protein